MNTSGSTMQWVLCMLTLFPLSPDPVAHAGEAPPVICRGTCDASAVVTIGEDHFLVADDEDNILRVYHRTRGGAPVQTIDLSPFLGVDPLSPETDLEGAAPAGDRVYWITSHARNKNGRERPSRYRFFALSIKAEDKTVSLTPLGKPYMNLLRDLLREPALKPFRLAAAAEREPKSRNALNIEGLSTTAEGHLLIGFRNPVPDGKALIVPLLNPAELLEGKRARFGQSLLLDLGGLGIRSIARGESEFLIVAGAYDGGGKCFLYRWKGGADQPERLQHPELAGLNLEAIEFLTENGKERLLTVSDDGNLNIGGEDCKSVADPSLKYFRATTIDP